MVYDINGNVIGNVYIEKPQTYKQQNSYMHISLDDVTYCIKNLSSGNLESLFDEPLFALLKKCHDDYNAVFSLYVYDMQNSGFLNMPTKYQAEFIANSGWLKIGFHVYGTGQMTDTTKETAITQYNAFANGAFTLCGGISSIDRIPRLNYYAGNLAACQGLRDANCGIIGLLTADDSRTSYYLTQAQAQYIRDSGILYDRNNGLVFLDTAFRLDWFVDGFTSENQYDVPTEDNPYDELVLRYHSAERGKLFKNLTVFLHEWRLYNSSYVIDQSMKTMLEQTCRFARDYNYDFDFPQNRLLDITSLAISE